MAGVKRKRTTAQEDTPTQSTSSSQPNTALDQASQSSLENGAAGRVTRSLRSSRAQQVEQNGQTTENESKQQNGQNVKEESDTDEDGRTSLIVVLKSHALIGNTIGQPAPAAAAGEANDSTQDPETPSRPKRLRRTWIPDESPRTTRSSARLKVNGPSSERMRPEEDTPTKQLSTSPRKRKFEDMIEPSDANGVSRKAARRDAKHDRNDDQDSRTNVTKKESEEVTNNRQHTPSEGDEVKESDPKPSVAVEVKSNAVADGEGQIEGSENGAVSPDQAAQTYVNGHSPASSRRRRSLRLENCGLAERSETEIDFAEQQLKMEADEAERQLEAQLQLQDGAEEAASLDSVDDVPDPNGPEASGQVTEAAEASNADGDTGSAPNARVRRRGRAGRGRGRGRARGGRAGRGGRGRPRLRALRDHSSDGERQRSPSPGVATQALRDRQRELAQAFKKVAAAQRLALGLLASQTERRLARDKNAHKNVPEYEHVQAELNVAREKRQKIVRREYELRVEQENRLFEAERERIQGRFKADALNIQGEHLLAAQGAFMALVEGQRVAEDEEHTEPEDSDGEIQRGIYAHLTRKFVRGFNSSFVRDPAGAALYERAERGWDDFVQRAKLGGDIGPQIKEMTGDGGGPFAGVPAREVLSMLLDASGAAAEQAVARPAEAELRPVPWRPQPRADALSALADAATSDGYRAAPPLPAMGLPPPHPHPPPSHLAAAPPAPHGPAGPGPFSHLMSPGAPVPPPSPHRTILPQPQQPPVVHGPTDPRSFMLPPVIPHPRQPPPPPPAHPRPLLPGRQPISPFGERHALPDPFAVRNGPPQLPPPPGSNFQLPPPPGFLQGPPRPPFYFPPHGPPYHSHHGGPGSHPHPHQHPHPHPHPHATLHPHQPTHPPPTVPPRHPF